MPSEASRKKARETCDHDHNTVGCWTCGTLQPCKPCEAIAAALDEARADGEQRGAERERWECHKIAAGMRVLGDDALGALHGAGVADGGQWVAAAIAARGAMRGPEEK